MSEFSEKYSLEKAQEDAKSLEEKIKSKEAANYSEAEKLVPQPAENKENHFELSREVIEKIVEKKIDINEPGTPFAVVDEFDIDELRKRQKSEIESVEHNKKTYKDFKKDRIKLSSIHNKYPLLSYKKDSLYDSYIYFGFKEKHGASREQAMKQYGLDKLGDILGNAISREDFYKKYEIVVEQQKAEMDAEIRLEYKEYLQDLEDKIRLPTKERYIEKYVSDAISPASRRTDLLRPQYYLDDVDSLHKRYLEFGKPDEEYDEGLYAGEDKSLVRTLALLGIYKQDRNFTDENDKYRSRFVRVDSEILDKEEFVARYEQALKEQDVQLHDKAIMSYERKLNELDERQVTHKSLEKMRRIFKNGILGGRRIWKQDYASMDPSEWAKDVREKRQERHVFFNMVDRFHNELHYFGFENSGKMQDSFFFKKHGYAHDVIAIVFDKKRLTYQMDDPNYAKGSYNRHDYKPDSEFGYAGPARIAPRRFQGIVISCTDTEIKGKKVYDKFREKEIEKVYTEYVLSKDQAKWDRAAFAIAKSMLEVYKDRPEKCVPIYDPNGNMLWPKKISAEEISSQKQN